MTNERLLKKLNGINQKQIQLAGPRYTPALDSEAPNLQIESVVAALDALSLSSSYRDHLSDLHVALEKASASLICKSLFRRRIRTPDRLLELLSTLSKGLLGSARPTLKELRIVANQVAKTVERERHRLLDKQSRVERHSKKEQRIQYELRQLHELDDAINSTVAFTRSPGFQLVTKNRLFLLGAWGTGKTHLLCDVTEKRIREELPTLLFLSHHITDGADPLNSVCQLTNVARTPNGLLRRLNAAGRAKSTRALIIFDGINESDRVTWRRGLRTLAQQVRRYPYVGVVVSCRTPFDQQILAPRTKAQYVHVQHPGFNDIEFDAQKQFFEHYEIPMPQIPLLTPEFSRPLFLKILCKSMQNLSRRTKQRRIRDISSGHKGMAFVLEQFVKEIGQQVEVEFNLSRLACWRMMKGATIPATGGSSGLAAIMADSLRNYVTPKECARVVREHTGWTDQLTIRNFIQRLVTEGLLSEDVLWEEGSWTNIIRLPYERFSDHLISRHLLAKHLRSDSERTIRESFYRNRPLGRVFATEQWGYNYEMPGLAGAIMLEFPERVKRVLPVAERELVFYLPQHARLVAPMVEPFLDGLLWRSKESFSKQTDYVVNFLLERGSYEATQEALEALVCLASRTGHPYSSKRLSAYLGKQTMADRDLFWSEFVRTASETSAIYRILHYLESQLRNSIDEQSARNLVQLCMLILTTTKRPLRDRATRALVYIGEVHPNVLFEETVAAFGFNDPYVPERLLAACYGVLMRRWFSRNEGLKQAASVMARQIYDLVFKPKAKHPTTHALSRDYAIGIIALARKMAPYCLGKRPKRYLNAPFTQMNAPMPAPARIAEKACAKADGALHMDFENYTVGRLVEGRANYDMKHPGYRGVLRQIKWRILDLGYDPKKFENTDRSIAQGAFYGRETDGAKTDRYGKKYSWIAYFETVGMRADAGQLPDSRLNMRTSDCDVDPSFPEPAREWTPQLKSVFSGQFQDPVAWAKRGPDPEYGNLLSMNEIDKTRGPWVLLDGFIEQTSTSDPRRVFTFLRGFFVKTADIMGLVKKIAKTKYPGNNAIPDAGADYYTYAGEIPWSVRYGGHLRTKSGRVRRNLCEAFESGMTKQVRKKVRHLTGLELTQLQGKRYFNLLGDAEDSQNDNDVQSLDEDEYVEIGRYIRIPGVRIEIPVHDFAWESYHSSLNQVSGAEFPAPAICERVGLRNIDNIGNLYDESGRLASLYRTFRTEPKGSRSHLTYLRRDLLRKYLRTTNQTMLWVVWGDRDFKHDELERLRDRLQDVWSEYEHIHCHVYKLEQDRVREIN